MCLNEERKEDREGEGGRGGKRGRGGGGEREREKKRERRGGGGGGGERERDRDRETDTCITTLQQSYPRAVSCGSYIGECMCSLAAIDRKLSCLKNLAVTE